MHSGYLRIFIYALTRGTFVSCLLKSSGGQAAPLSVTPLGPSEARLNCLELRRVREHCCGSLPLKLAFFLPLQPLHPPS